MQMLLCADTAALHACLHLTTQPVLQLVPSESRSVHVQRQHHKAQSKAEAVRQAQAAGAGTCQGLLPCGCLGAFAQYALVLWRVDWVASSVEEAADAPGRGQQPVDGAGRGQVPAHREWCTHTDTDVCTGKHTMKSYQNVMSAHWVGGNV